MIDRVDNFIASLGVEAYRVGGSVRDELLGRRPKDADYMIRGIGLRPLGALLRDNVRHMERGNVSKLVLRDGQQAGWRVSARGMGLVEIVLPRTDNPSDRDNFGTVVGPNIPIEADAKRRDFTFNALYKRVARVDWPTEGVATQIVDPTGRGLHDLQRGLIVTTHPDSFRDDPLRTLRALRFVARGFTLSSLADAEMRTWASAVTGLSANGYASGTVFDEMSKILMGENVADALRIARDTGVLAALFPELAPMLGFDQGSRYHDMTTDEHTFTALATAAAVDAPLRVRWALLFHDAGKPETAWTDKDGRKHYYAAPRKELDPLGVLDDVSWDLVKTEDHEVVGERLWREAASRLSGVPKGIREDVATLIRHHMVSTQGKFKASRVRRMRVQFGDDMLRDLLMHRACDISGKGALNKGDLDRIAMMEATRRVAVASKVPASVKDLQISGHDVLAAGYPGPLVGNILKAILTDVASQPNERTLSREWQMGRLGHG